MEKNILLKLKHNDVNWATPKYIYNNIMSYNTIDPCCYMQEDIVYFENYYKRNIYINPPFNQKAEFITHALRWVENECNVIMLLPLQRSRPYHYLYNHFDIVLFNHRLKFNDKKNAPFDCILVFMRKNNPIHNISVLTDQEIFNKINEFFIDKK